MMMWSRLIVFVFVTVSAIYVTFLGGEGSGIINQTFTPEKSDISLRRAKEFPRNVQIVENRPVGGPSDPLIGTDPRSEFRRAARFQCQVVDITRWRAYESFLAINLSASRGTRPIR